MRRVFRVLPSLALLAPLTGLWPAPALWAGRVESRRSDITERPSENGDLWWVAGLRSAR